jgi:hypothetical protein
MLGRGVLDSSRDINVSGHTARQQQNLIQVEFRVGCILLAKVEQCQFDRVQYSQKVQGGDVQFGFLGFGECD